MESMSCENEKTSSKKRPKRKRRPSSAASSLPLLVLRRQQPFPLHPHLLSITAASTGLCVPPPPASAGRSRKRARKITTLFHKLSRNRAELAEHGHDTSEIDVQIESMRPEYQRASQISTTYHSTSKWVLGCLAQNGWLYGRRIHRMNDNNDNTDDLVKDPECNANTAKPKKKQKPPRRPTRILEIGAINTQLLDAAQRTHTIHRNINDYNEDDEEDLHTRIRINNNNMNGNNHPNHSKKYRIEVRAIDLHSMHRDIEEADFLQLPIPQRMEDQYDVVVCSMVLNCVATTSDRGKMLSRLYHFTCPGGLVYLTIPKTCIQLSPFMDRARLENMLRAVGLQVLSHSKDSPKVAFFVAQRPEQPCMTTSTVPFDESWTQKTIIRKGKKYQNEFAVTLAKEDIIIGS
jgi:25S rRNA (adenine2142-N1)-methyltransferase